jgi:uncharacterized membrane protein YkoI
MLKRILYGSGAMGILAAGFLLGSVSLGGVFAQAAPTPTTTESKSQTGRATKEQHDANEQAEQAALASQAKVTADQAKAAALGKFPGATINKTELDSENKVVVYGVELTDTAGKKQDVKIDATSGQVLKVEADDAEGPETGDAD